MEFINLIALIIGYSVLIAIGAVAVVVSIGAVMEIAKTISRK